MTPDLLRKLEELREKATPGPWAECCSKCRLVGDGVTMLALFYTDDDNEYSGGLSHDAALHNRALAVAAVNALPELIAAAKAKERYEKALMVIQNDEEDDGNWARKIAGEELARTYRETLAPEEGRAVDNNAEGR